MVFMRPRDKQREADEAKQSFTHMYARSYFLTANDV